MSKQWAHSETDATQRRRSFQGCEGTALLVSETCRGPGYFIEQLLFPFYKYAVFVSTFFLYNGRNYIPVATSQAHTKDGVCNSIAGILLLYPPKYLPDSVVVGFAAWVASVELRVAMHENVHPASSFSNTSNSNGCRGIPNRVSVGKASVAPVRW